MPEADRIDVLSDVVFEVAGVLREQRPEIEARIGDRVRTRLVDGQCPPETIEWAVARLAKFERE